MDHSPRRSIFLFDHYRIQDETKGELTISRTLKPPLAKSIPMYISGRDEYRLLRLSINSFTAVSEDKTMKVLVPSTSE